MEIENGWIYQNSFMLCCDEFQTILICENCGQEADCAFCGVDSAPYEKHVC